MPVLVCMRGLPGSGKSTAARDGYPDFVRSNRDDLRASLFNVTGVGSQEQENFITKIQQHTVREALRSGRSVVIDDMHLRPMYLKTWNQIALEEGAEFGTHEVPTPYMECITRDRVRGEAGGRTVGAEVITNLAQKYYPKGKFLTYTPLSLEELPQVEKLQFDFTKPSAVVFDVDGTLTTGPYNRKAFDWAKVGQDLPRNTTWPVWAALAAVDPTLTFFVVSGRDGVCEVETREWIERHSKMMDMSHVKYTLLMRTPGDSRSDDIVKEEILRAHIVPNYNIELWLDDRPKVIRMLDRLGVPVWDVNPGSGEF